MNAEKIRKLLDYDTPTVANGLELLEALDPSAGYTGPDVRALMPEMGARVGIAVTARMDTTSPGMDRPESLFNDWLRLMQEHARGGLPAFAVLESVGPRPRYTVTIGDGMARWMKLAGAAGFVTNGSIRDLDGVRQVGLACWATGLSPMHGRIRWLDVGSPVVVDGMTVRTGDVIHADINGVLAIPAGLAERVAEKAEQVREKEGALFAKLDAPGAKLDQLLGR